jgi:hypothetical protein
MYRLLLCFVKAVVANISGKEQLSVPFAVLNDTCEAAHGLTCLPFSPAGTGCMVVCAYGRLFHTVANLAL